MDRVEKLGRHSSILDSGASEEKWHQKYLSKILQISGTKCSGSRSGVDSHIITTLDADLLLVTPPPLQPPPPAGRKLQPVEIYSFVQHQ